MREVSQSPIELEHGADWKDSYTTDYGRVDNQINSASVNSKPLTANDSQELLTGVEAQGGSSGIWTSTSVMVHYGGSVGPAYTWSPC